jgi:hypothetical protein
VTAIGLLAFALLVAYTAQTKRDVQRGRPHLPHPHLPHPHLPQPVDARRPQPAEG